MSEKSVDYEAVQEEHLREVNVPAHWAYLLGVLAGGTVLMLGLIALLGGSRSRRDMRSRATPRSPGSCDTSVSGSSIARRTCPANRTGNGR
jgi:hypothetical protein